MAFWKHKLGTYKITVFAIHELFHSCIITDIQTKYALYNPKLSFEKKPSNFTSIFCYFLLFSSSLFPSQIFRVRNTLISAWKLNVIVWKESNNHWPLNLTLRDFFVKIKGVGNLLGKKSRPCQKRLIVWTKRKERTKKFFLKKLLLFKKLTLNI